MNNIFSKKHKEIKENTLRIAKGQFMLAKMPNEMFIKTFKRMEAQKIKSLAKYKLPDWFTIKFIQEDKKVYKFVGSFSKNENEFPLVYKDKFLKLLKKHSINYEQLDEETYKIVRDPIK